MIDEEEKWQKVMGVLDAAFESGMLKVRPKRERLEVETLTAFQVAVMKAVGLWPEQVGTEV